jgi:Ubiquitin family
VQAHGALKCEQGNGATAATAAVPLSGTCVPQKRARDAAALPLASPPRRYFFIKVKDQMADIIDFKVHSGVVCGRIKAAFAEKRNMAPEDGRLLFDGKIPAEYATLGEIGVEDGDTLDFMRAQGGC